MLAPQPFFEPRGTPFSEYHRIKALLALGHQVDLVTYPFGADIALPNLRIYRSAKPPLLRGIRIGPSAPKVLLDVLLAITAVRRALAVTYDLIHSHEEAGVLGVWLARRLGIPHLYDMHSSLPQQLANFSYSNSRTFRALMAWIERRSIDQSQAIITICQELQDLVVARGAGDRAVLIENMMGGEMDPPPSITAVDVRQRYGIASDGPLALYTGTFEPYQGVDLLIGAAARLRSSHPTLRVLFVGGEPAQVEAARARAEAAGAAAVFAGQQPASEIPAYLEACDILVSPRMSGTNTPLKIYSYLRAGRPIVATNLVTHTQVLDSRVARLVPVDEASLAAALADLVDHPAERARLSAAAMELAARRYNREAFIGRTAEALARLRPAPPPVGVAAAEA